MTMDDAINKAIAGLTPERIAGMARLAKQQNDRLEKRKPLTDEQIDKLYSDGPYVPSMLLRDVARAIEAAHGIKENT